jgi:hypothetical protein
VNATVRATRLHSAPTVMSSAAAAGVEIVPRTPVGIYQIVYTHLTPGDGAFVHLFYVAPAGTEQSLMQEWRKGGMFEKTFASHFIIQFFFTGEHLKVSNIGSVDIEPAFESQ